MTTVNPYAPPTTSTTAASGVGGDTFRIYRDGNALVVPCPEVRLPARCVKCNAPAAGEPLKARLSWHPAWLYILVLLSLLIYIIAALIVNKRVNVYASLCYEHRRKRVGALWGGTFLMIGCLFLAFLGIGMSNDATGPIIIASVVGILVGALLLIVSSRVLTARHIDKEQARLKVGAPFLESFPNVLHR